MKLEELHHNEKEVSVSNFTETNTTAIKSIRILKDGELKKHITKVPAKLICISGETIYETEKDEKTILTNGMFVNIEPNVMHWLLAKQESQLLLMIE